ncbi:hypothetical protein FBU30_006085 [Linnemannia zychae]|nr:hypothetical protein FBU30_006085 [Linnemannia zychae]
MSASLFPIYCRGILFDMDGTLIDTTVVVERQWKNWCDAHNVDFNRLISVSHGRPTSEIIREFAPADKLEQCLTPESLAKFELSISDDVDGVVLIPGARELLARLPQGTWAVVTSAGNEMAKARFHQTGLTTPPIMVTATHITHGKPHPEGYLKAAKKLGLDPKDCVVFEDTVAGIRAGKAADVMAVIGMDTGTTLRDRLAKEGASPIIHSFNELEITILDDGTIEINRERH